GLDRRGQTHRGATRSRGRGGTDRKGTRGGGGMIPEDVMKILEKSEAVLSGHFLLSSGLHSDRYVQCALATRDPKDGERLGAGIAAHFKSDSPTLVIGPAL